MLSRAVEHGFFCYPAMVRDPWLDALRGRPDFTELLHKSQQLHRNASAVFLAAGGDTLLGMRVEGY
jgi:ATP/maltotriose-dependent transcriptional regulator MalT